MFWSRDILHCTVEGLINLLIAVVDLVCRLTEDCLVDDIVILVFTVLLCTVGAGTLSIILPVGDTSETILSSPYRRERRAI